MRHFLLSRLLIVIALAILLSSIIAFFFGVDLESTYKLTVTSEQGEAVIVAFSSISTKSQVKLELRGASGALTGLVRTDPREFMRLLLTSEAIRDLSMRTDVGGGVFYFWGSLSSLETAVSFIKRLGNLTLIRADGNEVLLSEELDAGTVLIVIARPSSQVIEVEVSRKTLDYERLTLFEALMLSSMLLALSLALTFLNSLRDRSLINRLS
ncbi:MAG: hypothetical protein QXN05_02235 [Acidilobaceae archaeon]